MPKKRGGKICKKQCNCKRYKKEIKRLKKEIRALEYTIRIMVDIDRESVYPGDYKFKSFTGRKRKSGCQVERSEKWKRKINL